MREGFGRFGRRSRGGFENRRMSACAALYQPLTYVYYGKNRKRSW